MSTIKLISNDKKCFTVNIEIAKTSTTIETMLEDLGMDDLDNELIPLPNVSGDILEKVLEWATHHKSNPPVNVANAEARNSDERTRLFVNNKKWEEQFLQVIFSLLLNVACVDNGYQTFIFLPLFIGGQQNFIWHP